MPPTGRRSEHSIQARFFAYLAHVNHPAVMMTFAVPNGFLRSKAMRLRAWREGVRAGIPDALCLFPIHPHPGCVFEFKSDSGSLSPEQKKYLAEFERLGFRVHVVRSAEKAFELWADYLELDIELS